MQKDILGRNIVSGATAWALKNLGFKGWVSGYYHENEYREAKGEDALAYYDYESLGNRSGFVNENSVRLAAAPTLIEAFQFLVDYGGKFRVLCGDGQVVIHAGVYCCVGDTMDEAIATLFHTLWEK